MKVLNQNFVIKSEKEASTKEFFELLKKLDEEVIKFIPLSSLRLYTAATTADKEDFFDKKLYCINMVQRNTAKKVVNRIDIDSLVSETGIEDFIDELLTEEKKDSLVSANKKLFFLTENALLNAASLCGLKGSAINNPSKNRDNFIAELMQKRCNDFAKKRKVKAAFTVIAFEKSGIKRGFAIRSGDYTAIPQSTIETLFNDIMSSDDWGEALCREWYIDHDISRIDIEFPEVESAMKKAYADYLPELPVVPGIRISTGSTGLNCLKVAMTWRLKTSDIPVEFECVAQKHCNTYDKETFCRDVHTTIWSNYGELPQRLAELYFKELPENSTKLRTIISSALNEMNIKKIFMQKDDDVGEKADYISKITEHLLTKISLIESATAYDLVNMLWEVPDRMEFPESYKVAIRKALSKAAFCKVFD